MGCFSVVRNYTGCGVSKDGVFQRMHRFSVEISIWQSMQQSTGWRVLGPFQEWPSFRGYGVSQSISISRSICKLKRSAKNRIGHLFFQSCRAFLHMLSMWRFQESLSDSQTPRNFADDTRSIGRRLRVRLRSGKGSFLVEMTKDIKETFVITRLKCSEYRDLCNDMNFC